jgi:acetyl esterase/lipase
VFFEGVIGYGSARNMEMQNGVAAVVFLLPMLGGCTQQPVSPANATAAVAHLMTPEELQALPSGAPDWRITYGTDSNQYGELRIPAGIGPHPLVILIHGGCFKAAYGKAAYFGAMADALKADGIATWNIEYRRLGQPGSGWPGTSATSRVSTTSISAELPSSATRRADTWRCGRQHVLA